LDGAGNLYISDPFTYTVRKVDISGIITTVGGTGVNGYSGDNGPATNAEMRPYYVAVDGCGNLYATEDTRVRKITSTGIITTIAGNALYGYTGDGGLATASQLNGPMGIKTDAYLNIYIADAGNNVIRKISNANHPPAFTAGHKQYMTICRDTAINSLLTVTDADILQTETWSVITAPGHGTLIAAYTAPTTGGAIIPTGLSYTPATGYVGNDSFKVQVRDCGNLTDSVMIFVTVEKCGALASPGLSTGGAELVHISPNPNDGSFTVNISSVVTEGAHLIITNVIGEKVKEWEATTNLPTIIQLTVPSGIYFLNAATKDGRYNAKFVVNP
jgi:hypothetical protein